MSPTFTVCLDGTPISKPLSEKQALNRCMGYLNKLPHKDYTVVKNETIFTPSDYFGELKGQQFSSLLEQELPKLMKSALNPKILPLMKKLSKAVVAGDLKRTQTLFTASLGAQVRCKNKHATIMINKCHKMLKEIYSTAQEGLDGVETAGMFISDITSYLEIAQALNSGKNNQAAKIVHSLDTGCREEVPMTVWNYLERY